MKRIHWFHANKIRRAIAGNAVSQHPYHRPPKLFEAIESVLTMLKPDKHEMIRFRTTNPRKKLMDVFKICFDNCPLVIAWNKPRKGKHTRVSTSRYWSVKPEYDFIDIDALRMNVVTQIINEP